MKSILCVILKFPFVVIGLLFKKLWETIYGKHGAIGVVIFMIMLFLVVISTINIVSFFWR
jgi:hypothetical protein